MRTTFKCLHSMIEKYNVIFMDVFDTALKRNITNPHNVFDLVQMRYNRLHQDGISSFRINRINAEERARINAVNSEINFEQIYEALEAYDDNCKSELMRLEWEIEQEISVENHDIKVLYKHCLESGKKVYFISDMYFGKLRVEKLLQSAGYVGYQDIYVSCDWQADKKTGNLFKLALSKIGVKSSEVFHIGDSKRADILGAIKAGIEPFYIKTYYENRLYPASTKGISVEQDYLSGFVNNSLYTKQSRASKIGYECLGPAIWGYCKWLQSKTDKNDNILFFSRDMHLFYKAYRKYYGSNCQYVYISRKSILPAVFAYSNKYNLIFAQWCERNKTMKDIFSLMNISTDGHEDLLKKYGYSAETMIDTSILPETDVFFEMLNEISQEIKSANQEKADIIIGYLNQFIENDKKNVLCDLGWYSTIQVYLELIYNSINSDISFEGYYVGVNEPRTDFKIEQNGYLYEPGRMENYLNSGGGLLECFCLEMTGSVKGYVKGNSGYCPVMDSCDQEYISYMSDLHRGALSFIKRFCESEINKDLNYKNMDCFADFIQLMKMPAFAELTDAKLISYEERRQYHLLESKGTLYYMIHPKQIINDVLTARWKAAFLKEVFKININYHDWYYKISNRLF